MTTINVQGSSVDDCLRALNAKRYTIGVNYSRGDYGRGTDITWTVDAGGEIRRFLDMDEFLAYVCQLANEIKERVNKEAKDFEARLNG